jgi:anti-sigma B factor antagonist
MPPSDATPEGLCWTGFGLTITVTRVSALRADLRVSGDLDMSSIAILKDALDHHLSTGRRYTRVDLSDLKFMDAAALGTILNAHWAFLEQHGSLLIDGLTARHRRVVQTAGLGDVLLLACEHEDNPEFVAN